MSIKIKEILGRPRTFTVPSKNKDIQSETLRVDAKSVFTIEEHQMTKEISENIKNKRLVIIGNDVSKEPTPPTKANEDVQPVSNTPQVSLKRGVK